MKTKETKSTDHRTYLYRLLSGRPYTEREVLEKLLRRGAERAEAESLVSEFGLAGLIDDELYARLFASGRDSWGNERIRYELRQKGVRGEYIDSALEEGDELARALPLAEGWEKQGLDKRKIASRLARRGFSSRIIRRVVSDAPDW